MKTEIFPDYDAFLKREDKSINGVSPEFAQANPDWADERGAACGLPAQSVATPLPITVDDIHAEDASQACPLELALGIAGIPRAEAVRRAPDYIAELDALPPRTRPIPNEPAALCWDARCLHAWGTGPYAQLLRQAFPGHSPAV